MTDKTYPSPAERTHPGDDPSSTTHSHPSRDRITRRNVLKLAGATAMALTIPSTAVAQESDDAELIWSFETQSGINSSPTVVDGTVYVGSGDGHLYAIDESGEESWRYDLGGTRGDSPSVIDGTVYIAADDLYALDAATGDLNWRASHHGNGIRQTVAGGVVFVTTGGELIAVDAATGDELWSFLEPAGASVMSAPVVYDRSVFVGLGAQSLYHLDTEDGSMKGWFQTETGGHVNTSPTVYGDYVLFGADDGYTYRLETATTDMGDRRPVGGGTATSPTIRTGTVYYGASEGFTGKVYGYDLDAVGSDPVFETPIDSNIYMTSPTVADGVVYIGSEGFDSYLWAFDSETGDPIWQYEADGWIRSSPTVADGVVYVGSQDGNLYAVDAVGSGSSAGSRVAQGTLGHHDTWASMSPTIDVGDPFSAPDTDDPDGDDDPTPDDGTPVEDTPTPGETGDEETPDDPVDADENPGIGAVGSVAAMGGAAYLLKRRVDRQRD